MTDWDDLLELEYEGVKLPASDFPFQGGHDAAEHRAYLRPGALQEPTGRQPYQGSCKCPLFNTPDLERDYGPVWPALAERIRARFEQRPIGRLVHPTLGPLTVLVASWSFSATSDARNGQELTFEWREHADSVADVVDLAEGSPQAIQSQASRTDEAVAAVDPSAPSTRDAVDSGLATAQDESTRQAQREAAFNSMLSTVDSVRARPDLATFAGATAQLELERLRARITTLRETISRASEPTRTYTTPRTMSLIEIAAEVYGSISTSALAELQAANGRVLSAPLEIPANTVIQVPPLVVDL